MYSLDLHLLVALFRDVIEINNVVGNTAKPSKETAYHQIEKIIMPEAKELKDGIAANDRHEIRDGVADVLFTVAGLFGRMGLPLDHLEELLYDSLEELTTDSYDVDACVDRIDRHLKALLVVVDTGVDEDYIVFRGIAISLTVWTIRLALLQMIHPDDDLREVVKSNWTKFDVTEEGQAQTREKYKAIGVETFYIRTLKDEEEGSPLYVTFSAIDQTGTDDKSYPKGKWLKSVNFKDTNFND